MATQSLPILFFIPMIISIASRLGYGKISSVVMTFGAMLVGLIGQTTATLGLDYLVSTMNVKITTNLGVRFGILAVSYILLNFFLIKMHKKEKNDSVEPIDLLELTGDEKKGKVWPYVLVFIVLFVFMILG